MIQWSEKVLVNTVTTVSFRMRMWSEQHSQILHIVACTHNFLSKIFLFMECFTSLLDI